ncbi:hypothetical protein CD351_11400 [Erythrobacter sp. KY5]|nr:hypothetical protein CD351_11400 [Erythrobacter sp. KY5]
MKTFFLTATKLESHTSNTASRQILRSKPAENARLQAYARQKAFFQNHPLRGPHPTCTPPSPSANRLLSRPLWLRRAPVLAINPIEGTSADAFGFAERSASCPASPRNGAWEAV